MDEASQRASDISVLFDAIRDKNDAMLNSTGRGLSLPNILSWLRTLKPVTLHQHVKAMSLPMKPSRGVWGDSIDLLIESQKHNLDDDAVALLLFISTVIDPMLLGGAAAQAGCSSVPIFDESHECLSGLYDTLRYHKDVPMDDLVVPLMGSNIYLAPQESRVAVTALLTVTSKIVGNDFSEPLMSPEKYNSNPPHFKYHGFHDFSLWLRNGELIRYALDRPEDAAYIASIIADRRTDDVGVITSVLDHEVSAFSSGSL